MVMILGSHFPLVQDDKLCSNCYVVLIMEECGYVCIIPVLKDRLFIVSIIFFESFNCIKSTSIHLKQASKVSFYEKNRDPVGFLFVFFLSLFYISLKHEKR